MVELAVMGGFADTKILSRTLSSQIHRLRTRCETFSNRLFLQYLDAMYDIVLYYCLFSNIECSTYANP